MTEREQKAMELVKAAKAYVRAFDEASVARQQGSRVHSASVSFSAATEALLNAAQPLTDEEKQLCKFYGVTDKAALIFTQQRHIEKLQAKLPSGSLAPNRVREG
jgi:hypothetical protein